MGAKIVGGGNTSISSSVDRGSTPTSKSSSSSSPTSSSSSTPKPSVRDMTEEEIQSNQVISSSVDRANGVDRSKERLQQINNEEAKAEFEANNGNIPAWGGASIMPGSLPTSAPQPEKDEWKNHINPDKSLVGTIKNKIEWAKSSYNKDKTFMENVNAGVQSQVESGQEKAKDAEVSGFSQQLMDIGTKVEEKADNYKQYSQTVNPTNPMQGEIVPSVIKSGASIVSMFSRVPAGAEIAAQTPSAIPNAVALAALGTAEYAVNTAKNDPIQLVTDIGVFSAFGAGLGKFGSGIKSKVPAVSTGETGFLLKTKVPETPTVPKPIVEPTTVGEFKGNVFGKDFFKFENVNNEVVVPNAPPKGINALIGESKGGYTDVYFKLNKNQAEAISKKYSGELENIKTSEGSFVSFEPTGKIVNEVFAKSDSPKLQTVETKLIGNEVNPSSSNFNNPIRFEKRTNLVEGELTVLERSHLALAEATRTMESKIVEQPKQLDSGLMKVQKNFFKDATAELGPKVQYMQKEPFIGEMQRMNVKFAEPNKAPTLKVKDSSVLDQQFKDFFEKATSKNKEPFSNTAKEYGLKRSPQPKRRVTPIVFGSPYANMGMRNKHVNDPTVSSKPIFDTKTETKPEASASPASPMRVTTTAEKSSYGAVPSIIKLKVPKYEYPTKTKSKKKATPKQEKDAWKYKRTTNKYRSPLDVKVKGGLI